MQINIISLAIFLLCLPVACLANGAVFYEGLHGAGVIPIQEDGIQLQEEEVTINVKTGIVNCRFVLVNTGNESRNFLMGFPFNGAYDSYGVNPVPSDFFNVYISGKETKAKMEKSTKYSHVYTWNMSFKGKEKKVVTCDYYLVWHDSSADGNQEIGVRYFSYITHTGGLWAGSISKAVFRIIFGEDADSPDTEFIEPTLKDIVVTTSLRPNGFVWDKTNGIAEYTFHNWKPSGPNNDITYSIRQKYMDMSDFFKLRSYTGNSSLYTEEDLYVHHLWDETVARGEDCVDSCDQLSDEQKEKNEMNLRKEYLKLLRNEIFARHGYSFKDTAVLNFFASFPWYKKNPNFSESLLSKTEKENIQNIIKAEKNNAAESHNKSIKRDGE